jgi:hypothetical protein
MNHSRSLLALALLLVGLGMPDTGHAAGRVPKMRGVTFGEWGAHGFAPRDVDRTLRRLAGYNVDTITVFVVWNQATGTATDIRPGRDTVSTSRLLYAIRAARRLKLRVILRPYVDSLDGTWRGAFKPSPPGAWFASYSRFIKRYATLAQREHVAGLVVGTEMETLSGDAQHWTTLVKEVRRRFHGFVTYQANWTETIDWWSRLDAISISGYYPLTDKPDYTVQDLKTGWRAPMARIRRLQRKYRLPVMFGEIGYRSIRGAAVAPWDISARPAASTRAQAIAYEAALATWWDVPWMRGLFWWYVPPNRSHLEGLEGADHQPAAPAMTILRRWYARDRR